MCETFAISDQKTIKMPNKVETWHKRWKKSLVICGVHETMIKTQTGGLHTGMAAWTNYAAILVDYL